MQGHDGISHLIRTTCQKVHSSTPEKRLIVFDTLHLDLRLFLSSFTSHHPQARHRPTHTCRLGLPADKGDLLSMAHPNLSHRRTHNLLLISKLLSQRDGASPFTLVLDSLEQPARVLLREYLKRAKVGRFHLWVAKWINYENDHCCSVGQTISH